MKITTLIPIRFNNGKKVPEQQLRSIFDELVKKFGGCSDEGITKGQWIDPADAAHYRDECLRVSVVCDRSLLGEVRSAIVQIGIALRQKAMYFEVQDYDGVQILDTQLPKD